MIKYKYLERPAYSWIPAGIYKIEHELKDTYLVRGLYHNKKRFRDLYPLELELL